MQGLDFLDPFCGSMRKGRKKDLRKFDLYEIVIRILTTVLCIAFVVAFYLLELHAPELQYFAHQEVNKCIVEMVEEQ